MKNLTIGICCGGTVRAETISCLLANMPILAKEGFPVGFLFQIGGYVDVNRNAIVDSVVRDDTTHIMFLDADHTFPEDAILKLLKHDKDIVGGNYNTRLDPFSGKQGFGPVTKMMVEGEIVSMASDDFPTELFKCYATATGFMMIKTEIFKKLKKPYFDARIDSSGRHFTEDIDFCMKANDAGIEVWCDPTIQIGHIGSTVY